MLMEVPTQVKAHGVLLIANNKWLWLGSTRVIRWSGMIEGVLLTSQQSSVFSLQLGIPKSEKSSSGQVDHILFIFVSKRFILTYQLNEKLIRGRLKPDYIICLVSVGYKVLRNL